MKNVEETQVEQLKDMEIIEENCEKIEKLQMREPELRTMDNKVTGED